MSINTGIYRRILRDDRWEDVLLEDHTENELKGLFYTELETGSEAPNITKWVMPLIEALRASEAYRSELQDSILKEHKTASQIVVVNSDGSEVCAAFINSEGETEYSHFTEADGGVYTDPETNIVDVCSDTMNEYASDCDIYLLKDK